MRIAVVIPSFRARKSILSVLNAIGSEVSDIFVVDDACQEQSGTHVENHCHDPRVSVLFHSSNQGVGAAMATGYRAALNAGADLVVKIDADGQMDPALLSLIAEPVLSGRADYSKGNRFFNLRDLDGMPPMRLLGNSVLSFITKLSSGYYGIVDPTNGYLAIHRNALELLELEKLEKRYFFESDMLFRLNLISAVVEDVPMRALYADEQSSLKIGAIILPFARKHACNFAKRLFYNYVLRDFNYGSLNLLAGIVFLMFGLCFGLVHWMASITDGKVATAGTVMLAALPLLIGLQLISNFFTYDMHHCPTVPISSRSKAQQLLSQVN